LSASTLRIAGGIAASAVVSTGLKMAVGRARVRTMLRTTRTSSARSRGTRRSRQGIRRSRSAWLRDRSRDEVPLGAVRRLSDGGSGRLVQDQGQPALGERRAGGRDRRRVGQPQVRRADRARARWPEPVGRDGRRPESHRSRRGCERHLHF
jgi:hypothetical protein